MMISPFCLVKTVRVLTLRSKTARFRVDQTETKILEASCRHLNLVPIVKHRRATRFIVEGMKALARDFWPKLSGMFLYHDLSQPVNQSCLLSVSER